MLFLAAFIFPQKSPKEAQTKAGSWEPRSLTRDVAGWLLDPRPCIQLGPRPHSRVTQPSASRDEGDSILGSAVSSLAHGHPHCFEIRPGPWRGGREGWTPSSPAPAHTACPSGFRCQDTFSDSPLPVTWAPPQTAHSPLTDSMANLATWPLSHAQPSAKWGRRLRMGSTQLCALKHHTHTGRKFHEYRHLTPNT